VKYFRAAEGRLRDAVAAFEREASSLSGVVNLGDLYDGYNEDDKTKRPVLRGVMSAATLERNRHDLGKVASILNASNLRFHHCLGNHDLSVSRDEFLRAVNAERGAYYSERLPRRWLLIVLDTTDLNPRYIAEDTPEYQSALDFATEAYASGRDDIAPWSGGIGPIQLAWFDNELKRAKERGERVIVASHNALQANAARPQMSAWNADQVSKIIEDSGCVKICLAGHDHPGMYNYRHGVHYVTLEAMLEAKPAQKTSYAFLDVFEHEAVLTGVGAASSRRMRVSPLGVFTGIATFGAATIGELATSGTSGRAETSSLGLLDWINTYGRDYEG
jgi:manganese-dependent ADP-ribose/CDP-alcohol diphosphatase